MLCEYWCSQESKFQLKNWKFCCSQSSSSCSEVKRKNSESCKKRYQEGRLPNTIKWKMRGWEDKTKEELEEIKSRSLKTFKDRIKNWSYIPKKRKHTLETKEKLSNIRINFLEKHNNHNCTWYQFEINWKNLYVQWTWEKKVAEKLSDLWLVWERKKIKYCSYRTYTPDFYLPELNLYIEVKWFMWESDKYKMFKVLDEHTLDLRLIDSLPLLEKLTKKSDLFLLPKFKEKYIKKDIDFSKFNNYWDLFSLLGYRQVVSHRALNPLS